MNKVAIILAAGYKAIGWGFPGVPPVCPEALLPIGEEYGSTPVERLATQLKQSGYQSFVAVGRPGCRYTGMLKKALANKASQFPAKAMPEADRPPWTPERVKYIAQFGHPLLMPDPDMKSYDDSAMQCLDIIGYNWNKLVILPCDFVWSADGPRAALEFEAPCQVMVKGRHMIMEVLTPEAARLYRQLGDKFRQRERWGWTLEMSRWGETGLSPEGWKFREHAPYQVFGDRTILSGDLDAPKDYRYLTEHWLPKYG